MTKLKPKFRQNREIALREDRDASRMPECGAGHALTANNAPIHGFPSRERPEALARGSSDCSHTTRSPWERNPSGTARQTRGAWRMPDANRLADERTSAQEALPPTVVPETQRKSGPKP